MHIRDRLRAAFLQKRASQICWRCTLLPHQQLRSVQTATAAGLDNGTLPKEPELPLLSTNLQSGSASGSAQGPVSAANHGNGLVPTSRVVNTRARRRHVLYRYYDVRVSKVILPYTGSDLDPPRNLRENAAVRQRSAQGRAVARRVPSKSMKNRRLRGEPNRIHPQKLYKDVVQDRKRGDVSKRKIPHRTLWKNAIIEAGQREDFARTQRYLQAGPRLGPGGAVGDKQKQTGESTAVAQVTRAEAPVLILKYLTDRRPDAVVKHATADQPIWEGRNRHRIYLMRGVTKRVFRISYEDLQSRILEDEEGNQAQAGRATLQEDDVLEETEDLLESWLKTSEVQSRYPSARKSSVVMNDDSKTDAPNQGESCTPAIIEGNQSHIPQWHHHSPRASEAGGRQSSTGLLGMPTRRALPDTVHLFYGNPVASSAAHVARLHTSTAILSAMATYSNQPSDVGSMPHLPGVYEVGIREHLKLWQDLQDKERSALPASDLSGYPKLDATEIAVPQSGEERPGVAPGSSDPALARDLGLISVPDKEGEGETDVHTFLQPGDVIGFRTSVESMLAIFIRNFESQAQFYSMQGKWFHMGSRYVSFTIPQVFSRHDIERIMAHLPQTEVEADALNKFQEMQHDVPRELGAPLLEKLQAIQSASAEFYREHAERLDRVHSLVSHEHDATEITLPEIAMIALQKDSVDDLSDIMRWTVHKALIRSAHFQPQAGYFHRGHPLWRVNPKAMMTDFNQVRAWIRSYLEGVITRATSPDATPSIPKHDQDLRNPNPIPHFMNKAKRLVKRSRTQRAVTAQSGMGPITDGASTTQRLFGTNIPAETLATFDSEQTALINYLKSWCISWDIPAAGNNWGLAPLLLRATGLYEGHDLNEQTGFLFLQELGVIAPWENRFAYERNSHLPDTENSSEVEKTKPADAASGPTNMQLDDSLEGIRKDWGNMPVYCIDEASAQEIDDGVSLERIAGEDSSFWVHVHIANPSAFLSPDSAISDYASSLAQTIYLPEKVYPLLNADLSQRYFSLTKDRPVVTLSAKLSSDGEILATDITAGWIRNTKKITPSRLTRELGLDQKASPDNSQILHVGQAKQPEQQPTVEDHLSPAEIEDLRTLQKLGDARRVNRTGGEGSSRIFHGNVPDPHVYLGEGGIPRTFNAHMARQFPTDPSISWEASEVDMTGELSRSDGRIFVTDIMVLAGEVAARWCGERNIPIIYRGTIRDPSPPMSPEAYKRDVIDRTRRELGYVPTMMYRVYNRSLGQSTSRSSPFSHAIMCTQAYTKATSPLRRYPDMLVHWQIQAALLHEARHGKGSLIGNPAANDSYLPFTRARIDALIPTLELRERAINEVTKRSKVHWIMQLLSRAFYFQEAPLPQVFDVLVHQEPRALLVDGNALGYTRQLSGLDADLLENEVSKREGGIRVGDWWRCRMEGVDTYGARLRMLPVGLTERGAFGLGGCSKSGGVNDVSR